MALRTIRVDGDPILRKKSKIVREVNDSLNELIDDMSETLIDSNGVGLAAVQVGILKRLCIINIPVFDEEEEDDEEYEEDDIVEEEGEEIEEIPEAPEFTDNTDGQDLVVINPEVIHVPEYTQTGSEGCLSIPGKYGVVTRPYRVILKAYDRNLEPYEVKAEGLLARAICHECEHMDGILYKDKVEGELFSAQPEEKED